MNPVLVDTGFLVALFEREEHYHRACAEVYEGLENPLVTCEAVLFETLYLLRRNRGAAGAVLASIEQKVLEIPFRLSASAAQVQMILDKYRDMHTDLADACLVQMADELSTGDILTLDNDFRHYRWRRNRQFNLLIPLD